MSDSPANSASNPVLREQQIADRLSKIFNVKFYPPGEYPNVEYAELTNGVALVGKKKLGEKYMAVMTGNPWHQGAVSESITKLSSKESGAITLNHAHTGYYIDPAVFEKNAEEVLGGLQQAYILTGHEAPEAVGARVHEGGKLAAAIPGTDGVQADETQRVEGKAFPTHAL